MVEFCIGMFGSFMKFRIPRERPGGLIDVHDILDPTPVQMFVAITTRELLTILYRFYFNILSG